MTSQPYNHFGPVLREARELACISQSELARRMGTKPSAVSASKDGSRYVSFEHAQKWVRHCGIGEADMPCWERKLAAAWAAGEKARIAEEAKGMVEGHG